MLRPIDFLPAAVPLPNRKPSSAIRPFFERQQFHIIIKFRLIRRLEHYPLWYMSVPPEEDDANSALTSALAIAACAPSDKSYSKGIVVMRSCPKMLKTVSRQLSISGWQQIRLYFTAKHDICLPINKIWNDAERGCLIKAAALCAISDIRSISTLHIPLPHWSP